MDKLAKLKELFPEVFTEGDKIDWDRLRLSLGAHIDTGAEQYGLQWVGRTDCFKTIRQPATSTLIPDREESVDFDNTRHIFIEGDNLEALRLLQTTHQDKIRMIYIDPPYNTGADFIYSDKYGSHSSWMNMIYPRLYLARNLLRPDGIIFISIDNNEIANLRKICDEIYGEDNFIEQIVWKNKYGAGAKTRGFIEVHEYILCYSKSPIQNIEARLNDEQLKTYKLKDEKFDIRGGYMTQPLMTTSLEDRKNLQYSITYNGDEITPEKQWVWEKTRLERAIANNEVVFNKKDDGKYSVRFKQYLKDDQGRTRSGKPLSLLNGPFNQDGTADVKELFGYDAFTFPKPVSLLKYLLSFTINGQKDNEGIYLDFFAGSGSMAQAIYELNAQDQGQRTAISIQLPQPLAKTSPAYKHGLRTIADVCKTRIRMAGEKTKGPSLDTGLKVFKLQHAGSTPAVR